MKNHGFVLIDILIGLFFVGFISLLSLPLLTSSYSNYGKINARTEMNYLGESVYERLSAKDEYSRELLEQLESGGVVSFLDLGEPYLEKYKVTIRCIGECESFIDIKIIIQSNSIGGNNGDVEFKGSILK